MLEILKNLKNLEELRIDPNWPIANLGQLKNLEELRLVPDKGNDPNSNGPDPNRK